MLEGLNVGDIVDDNDALPGKVVEVKVKFIYVFGFGLTIAPR